MRNIVKQNQNRKKLIKLILSGFKQKTKPLIKKLQLLLLGIRVLAEAPQHFMKGILHSQINRISKTEEKK